MSPYLLFTLTAGAAILTQARHLFDQRVCLDCGGRGNHRKDCKRREE